MHRFRNLGEDLWHLFADDPRVSVDLAEVDKAMSSFQVETRKSLRKKTAAQVFEVVHEHGLGSHCVVKSQ